MKDKRESDLKDYLKLLRVKHYIKNLLIFMPLFFGQQFFDLSKLVRGFAGYICFCLVSSAIYILNDTKDIEKDRAHPKKKNRPLASGKISIQTGIFLMVVCLVAAISIYALYLKEIKGILLLMLYVLMNVAYSMGLKNKPIIDVVILAAGFVIRIFYGGAVTGVEISGWLYLVIVTGSLYMGLGKRRNELKQQTDTREVLRYYNVPFLDKNMYVCVALADVFYALWAMESADKGMIWTVPIFLIIMMTYSLDAEGNSDGDPVEIILHDKKLICMALMYAVTVFVLLYII